MSVDDALMPHCTYDPRPKDPYTRHWCSGKPVVCEGHQRLEIQAARLSAATRMRDAIVSYVMDNLPTHALSNEAGRMADVRMRMDVVRNANADFILNTINGGDSGGEGVSGQDDASKSNPIGHSVQAAEPPRPDPGYRMIPHEQYKHAIESAYSRGQHAERARAAKIIKDTLDYALAVEPGDIGLDTHPGSDYDNVIQAARAYLAEAQHEN